MDWHHFKDLDKKNTSEIRDVQTLLLKEHISYLLKKSPYYSRLLTANGFKLESIRSIEDIQTLPVTDKNIISNHYSEMVAVSESEIVDLCQTSGTTGDPLHIPQTKGDWERLEWNEKESIASTGITKNDRVLIACSITRCFMAGLAYYQGLKCIGATSIRSGADNPQYVIQLIESAKPTAIIGVPSLLVRMGRIMEQQGKNASSCGISRIICIGEPVRDMEMQPNEVAKLLTNLWGAKVYGTYASTEIASSFCECEEMCGGHVLPELCYTEILGENDQPVVDGEWGEVVVTPFGVKGLPLLRFKTGDISKKITDPCACGKKTFRLAPIIGRKQQMLKVKGCTLYPNAVLNALKELEDVEHAFIEAFSHFDLADDLRIILSSRNPNFDKSKVSDFLTAKFRFRPRIEIRASDEVAKRIFDPAKRKPVTFFDLRTTKTI